MTRTHITLRFPPRGIAEALRRSLPEGGLVLDPFAGSGVTGVAALSLGEDVVLNELSPAASFSADRFTRCLRSVPADPAGGIR
jgi:16S rRNA G966 N2-methylase RsmD